MDTWESHYHDYRRFVMESLIDQPTVVISPDNDDLPPEEAHFNASIGSYEQVD